MLHSAHISLSASGSSASPTRTAIKVNKGVIYRVWVNFPAGCAGLVKLRVLLDGHPIIPVHKDGYLNFDNFIFEVPIYEEVKEEPQTLAVEGWNEDDTYDHTVDIYFLIVDKKYILPVGAYEGIIAALSSIMRSKIE